jgi:hypothetical protein
MGIAGFARWLLLPAGALALSLGAASTQAQTDGVSQETRQLCAPDALRLCKDFVPDVPKITACMTAKKMQVSPACRAAMDRETRDRAARARLQTTGSVRN